MAEEGARELAMRNCPHCNNEIQDEAIFCRFCRREVEPPLWLTSLQKCPYCAEWVERGIDRCPLCGKAIATGKPFSTELTSLEQAEEPRVTPPFTDALEEADEGAQPSDEPPFHRTFMPQSEVAADKPYDETESQPPDEGIAVLHARRLEPLPDLHSAQLAPQETARAVPSPKAILRGAAILLGFAGAIATGVWIYGRLPSINEVAPPPTKVAAQASATSLQAGLPVEATQSPFPTARPLPTPTHTEEPCHSWEEITLEDKGQTICAYGTLKRWFVVQGFPYVAIFSEEPGTFAIVDRTQSYPQFPQGTCIQATGEVEIMRGTRPFIDAKGALKSCGNPDE